MLRRTNATNQSHCTSGSTTKTANHAQKQEHVTKHQENQGQHHRFPGKGAVGLTDEKFKSTITNTFHELEERLYELFQDKN